MNRDLSVIITARNEEFLSRTVDGVLASKRGNTEIIVVCDGNWPNPPVQNHPDVVMIYNPQSIGQRAAINEAARLSRAKFIMKLDAHCVLDEGFDVKLMADCEPNWTVVPRLYNLYGFDWKCRKCGNKWYQGPTPKFCQLPDRSPNKDCDSKEFERILVWQPNWRKKTDFMRFDNTLHFQYWGDLSKRSESAGNIADTMSLLGACFFMHRDFYWKIGGSEEGWGSWGQQGTEIACKTWLSGGRLVVNKNTWYSHLFRTQGGSFGFPYPQDGNQIENARKKSREFFMNNTWVGQVHPLSWLLEKFWPVPGWSEKDLEDQKKRGEQFYNRGKLSKEIIFYTDNQLKLKIAHKVQDQLSIISKEKDIPITSCSLKPMSFGKNICLPLNRGYLTMAKQILAALKVSNADIVYFCEHDVLYHPSHFDFVPPKNDVYYYNTNVWRLRLEDGLSVKTDNLQQLSGLCGYRKTLLDHYQKRVELLTMAEESSDNFSHYVRRMGFEPGTHNREERVDSLKAESWESEFPNIDIRHDGNLTPSRWEKSQFRNKKFTRGWLESYEIPGWGKTDKIV